MTSLPVEDAAALVVDDLSVNYRNVPACRRITLTLDRGQCTAVVGANGAGKSSLVAAIAGLTPAWRGTVSLAGQDISRLPAFLRARAGLALVPEARNLFPEMTVGETLRLAARPDRVSAGRWDRAAVLKLFPQMRDRETSLAGNLSGGERQMLAIARGLLLNPFAILLDEPSAGLAPGVVEELIRAIQNMLHEGMAVLLVEQSVHAARVLGDHVAVMQDGAIVQRGGREVLAGEDSLRRAYLGRSE